MPSLVGQRAFTGFVTVMNRNANHSTHPLERQLSSFPVFITAASLLAVLLYHGTAVKILATYCYNAFFSHVTAQGLSVMELSS